MQASSLLTWLRYLPGAQVRDECVIESSPQAIKKSHTYLSQLIKHTALVFFKEDISRCCYVIALKRGRTHTYYVHAVIGNLRSFLVCLHTFAWMRMSSPRFYNAWHDYRSLIIIHRSQGEKRVRTR